MNDGAVGKRQWRLNQVSNPGVPGGWVAMDTDTQPWLQISLYRQTLITGIIVQGREDEDQWVTSYKVQTSLDGNSWNYVPGIDTHGDANEEEVSFVLLNVINNACLVIFLKKKAFTQYHNTSENLLCLQNK